MFVVIYDFRRRYPLKYFLIVREQSMKTMRSFLSVLLLISALVCLPGCWSWVKNKISCPACLGEPVITFDHKSRLSSGDLDKKLAMIYQSRPGIQEMIAQMPEEEQLKIYKQIVDGILAEQLIREYAQQKGLTGTKEYKENAKQAYEELDCNLAVRAFQEEMNKEIQQMLSKVSEDEARKFYNENNDKLPVFQQAQFMKKPAHAWAKGFVVKDEKEGRILAAKIVATQPGDIARVARDHKKIVVDYDSDKVSDYRVRAALTTIKGVDLIHDSKDKLIVVQISKRQAADFVPFDKVKDAVKQVMVQDKVPALYTEKMEALKKECKVSVNEEYLKHLVVKKADVAQESAVEQPKQTTAKTKAA